MGTRDGRYYIVFNGEIYNYRELRKELEAGGQIFRSRSDTEVLLTAYATWGLGVLNRLVGMFAFAILDITKRTLLLARDFFGIKPLYYTYWRDGFAFASEIRPLLDLPGVNRNVNPQRLYQYLRFGITDHGGESLIADVKQLPAAHWMVLSLDNPMPAHPERYWHIEVTQKADLSFNEAADRLRELFLENVRLHLRSDVPVGAALSGGIDSSSIVMAMRHLDRNLDIHAFSYVADDPRLSEESWIDLLGAAAKVNVHKVKANPEALIDELDALIKVQGEPFGSTSIYSQRRVFENAHELGVKVMLDGQGADEILGGYHFYIAARLSSLLRRGHWIDATRLLHKASRMPELGFLSLLLRAADFLIPSNLQEPLRRLIGKDLSPPWMNARWFKEHGVEQTSPGFCHGREILKELLHHTLIETSLPALLRYEDRNSMGYSIESRVPFLTPALVNFLFSLPEDYIIAPDGTTKSVFRKAMIGIVPNVILERKDKIGFATPEQQWLFSVRPWVERVLTTETALQIQALDLKEVRREWEGILQGHKSFDWRVWRWINTILWAEKFNVAIQ